MPLWVGTRHALRGAPERFKPQGAVFDGTNDYLSRGADLTGSADGKECTVSVWLRIDGGDGTARGILGSNHANASVRFATIMGAANDYRARCRTSGGSGVFVSDTSNIFTADGTTWRHCLFSGKADSAVAHLYVDDALNEEGETIADLTIDYTTGNVFVGADSTAAAKFFGAMAELWFHPTYIDFSVEANRRKFITADSKPAFLGGLGELPLGSQPLLYLSIFPGGAATDFAVNRGSGGNFTITGSLDLTSGPAG